MRCCLVIVATFLMTGCATAFQGAPHVEGNRAGCKAKCSGQGMALTGMVYMGEYSNACICEVPGSHGGHASKAAGATGSAVAVIMAQRTRAAAQQQRY